MDVWPPNGGYGDKLGRFIGNGGGGINMGRVLQTSVPGQGQN